MPTSTAYLFGEIAALLTLILFTYDQSAWRKLAKPNFFWLLLVLALFWFVVEQIAIHFNIWSFTGSGVVGLHAGKLPLEEYIFIISHILYTAVLTVSLHREAEDEE